MFEPRNKVWVGLRRQGKTIAMVRQCRESLIHGIKVYSNITIRFVYKNRCYFSYYCKTGQDFLDVMHKAKNAIIAVDEIGLVFPNQYWNRLDMATLALFKESGHIGIAFWGTTHTLGDIVGKLRDVVDDVILCRKEKFFIFSSLPRVKNWKNIFKAIFLPLPQNIKKLFTQYKQSWNGQMYRYNETFTSTPAYIFKQFGMRKGYKGTGGARQFYASLLWTKKLYPSDYIPVMLSYNTKQRVDHNVMVRGNESVAKGYRKSYKKSDYLVSDAKRAIKEANETIRGLPN